MVISQGPFNYFELLPTIPFAEQTTKVQLVSSTTIPRGELIGVESN